MSKYISLSYLLNENLSAYANGAKLKINKVNSIKKGDTSNNSILELSSHLGTHIDFPYHFCELGKKSSEYTLTDLIFNKIGIVEINMLIRKDLIIGKQIYSQIKGINSKIELLIIKTHFSNIRKEKKYWSSNPGFQPYLANYLKKKLPKLKAVGFDSISLSSFTNRELGRKSHREFLCENNILIIEDMNLSQISLVTKISKIIVAPLLIENTEGAPVNIIAEIEND